MLCRRLPRAIECEPLNIGPSASHRSHQLFSRQKPTSKQTEQPMKLSTARVKQTLGQLEQQDGIENAVPVPEDSPVAPQLCSLFGDHTFFLDSDGLHIVEPLDPAMAAEGPTGQLVKLAGWVDSSHTALAPQEPEPTDIVIVLGADDGA